MSRIRKIHTRLGGRDCSCVELTAQYIAAIERQQPTLNAYITVTAEQARQVPQKPAAAQVLPVSGGSLSADKILAQEPGRIQAAYQSLPKVAQRAIVKKGRM